MYRTRVQLLAPIYYVFIHHLQSWYLSHLLILTRCNMWTILVMGEILKILTFDNTR
jgi:hypothetical protein